MSLTRFRFHTWSRNCSHRDSGVEFSLLLTRSSDFSAIYMLWWDTRASKKTCALIGYQRVKNLFSFDSLVDSQKRKKKKKRNACNLLNTSYNVVTKQFIFVIWIKAFLVFLVKTWSHRFVPNENKTKQTKITTRLADSFGNSMVHDNILLSCNISFDPLLRESSFRSLKCSERN